MVPVVSNTEGTFNDFGNARGRPQFCVVSVFDGSAQEYSDQASFLRIGQFRSTSGSRSGTQSLVTEPVSRIPPSHDGTGVATDLARNLAQRHSRIYQLHGFATTLLEQLRGTEGTHRGTSNKVTPTLYWYGSTVKEIVALIMQVHINRPGAVARP